MKRIDSADNPIDLGGGRLGFTEGNPPSVAPSLIRASWLNGIQEEIAGAIEASGIVLDDGNPLQLLEAMKKPHKVTANVTLLHGTDFTDFNEALSRYENRYIMPGVTITLSMSATALITVTTPILIKHPQGDQIKIIGDIGSPDTHKISFNPATFPANSGVFETLPGGRIGGIDGIRIEQAAGVPNGRHFGVKVGHGAKVTLGSMKIASIAGSGILVEDGGYCDAKTAQVLNCTSVGTTDDGVNYQEFSGFGMIAKNKGLLKANGATLTNCNIAGIITTRSAHSELINCNASNAGYHVSNGSTSYMENCVSIGFGSDGFRSDYGSKLVVKECTSGSVAFPNFAGFVATLNGTICVVASSLAEYNSLFGFQATIGSQIVGDGLTANNNGSYGAYAEQFSYISSVSGVSNGTALTFPNPAGNGTTLNRVEP